MEKEREGEEASDKKQQYAKKAIAGGYGIPWRLPSRILPIELKTVSSILLAHAQLVVD